MDVSLHIPRESELDYRRFLISDEATMSYNAGYGDCGGCTYPRTPEQVRQWYAAWDKVPGRFYAYIVRNSDGAFVGEVNLHESGKNSRYEMGIVVEAKYRGLGYSAPALRLLLRQAFDGMGASAVHNDFEESRAAAIKTHLSAGFDIVGRRDGIIDLLVTREKFVLDSAVAKMSDEICAALSDCSPSVYIYGSVALGDFKPGWSDIDILCLTEKPMSDRQAGALVKLRQTLHESEPSNPHYRSFEGAILTRGALLTGKSDTVVYWGSSGQKITDSFRLDSFSAAELVESGILLRGRDVRSEIMPPTREQLRSDIVNHYGTVRKYAAVTGRSIKSCGWLLDVARCLYTLRTGKIIAKTAAGEWALENGLCPVPDALRRALLIRSAPLEYASDASALDFAASLGSDIQRFADVLQRELGI